MSEIDEHRAAQERIRSVRNAIKRVDVHALELLFTEARTHYAWRDKPVSDNLLREIYEITKWGPTSSNQQPARYLFIRTREAKERLAPALSEANVPKMMDAPVTAIICYDEEFFEHLPRIYPIRPAAANSFRNSKEKTVESAIRNGTLQGAYFIIAARALGLDTGPMSGFDNTVVDDTLLGGTHWKSNFLCNLGFGDETKTFKRLPRLDFDEVSRLL